MDLTLNDDQHLLVEAARGFLQRVCPSAVVRELDASDEGFTSELWEQFVDLGWSGMALPAAKGGAGAGLAELCLVAEELGRVALSSPLLTSVAGGALPIAWLGDDQQQGRWLEPLVSKHAIATLALMEDEGHDEWSDISVAGRRQGERWILSGAKILVPYAAVADTLLATVNLEGLGYSVVILDK